jgi:hypothetical protein
MHPTRRPRSKTAAPLLRGSGELHVVGRHDVTTIPDPDGVVHRLFELADGSRSTAELYRALAVEHPRLAEQDVVAMVADLESAGLFEYSAAPRRIAGDSIRGERTRHAASAYVV